MKRIAAILFGCLVTTTTFAQSSAISRSGQFVITGVAPGTPHPYLPSVTTNATLVKLEPALLAVSCERIKQALLGALGVPDQWRGKIHVTLHPAREADEEIMVAATRFANDWNYELSLPDPIAPVRLIRAVTQVLLVEMANRPFPAQSAALPAWLAEGMPQYLMATSDIDLVLKPASGGRRDELLQRTDTREGRRVSAFSKARERLRQRTPLTIKQLSYPDEEQLAGLDGETYRDTALFFINELLQLKNGGECLFAMLPELAWDPDWRVGFLKAFKPHFQREMDFEKWWALQSAYIASRDANQTWPRAESVAKLEEILRTPFEVRLGSNEPALYTDVSLQAIIKGWKLGQQAPVLREKVKLLEQLQFRVVAELKPLVQHYRNVLATYLDKMGASATKPKAETSGKHPFATAHLSQVGAPAANNPTVIQALTQLDILDARLAAWKVTHDKAPAPPVPVR